MAFGRESDRVKIRLAGVEKSFGPKRVLDGIDLEIYEGESLVIIGGSGSGKSVLLKHVIGLLHPDAGTVHVDDVEIHHLSNREITRFRRRFGMAFQEGALFDSMTVRQNVAFPLVRQTQLSRREIDARVDECLEMVRLTGAAEKLPAQLSGGMRRRAGFARAIAMEPDIVLFDEPTTGLDPVTTAVIDEVIVDMLRRLPSTAITITHDMTSAFRIADRIGMIYEGRIIALAPPDEIRRTADPRVRQFIEGRSIGPLAAPEEPGEPSPAAATPSRDTSRGAPSTP